MNRAEKINLLRSIETGNTPLDALQPAIYLTRIGYNDNPGNDYFINGKAVSREEFDNRRTKEPDFNRMPVTVSYGDNEKDI